MEEIMAEISGDSVASSDFKENWFIQKWGVDDDTNFPFGIVTNRPSETGATISPSNNQIVTFTFMLFS